MSSVCCQLQCLADQRSTEIAVDALASWECLVLKHGKCVVYFGPHIGHILPACSVERDRHVSCKSYCITQLTTATNVHEPLYERTRTVHRISAYQFQLISAQGQHLLELNERDKTWFKTSQGIGICIRKQPKYSKSKVRKFHLEPAKNSLEV